MAQSFVEYFAELFEGHPDHYAIWFEPRSDQDRGLYSPSTWEPRDEDHSRSFYRKIQEVVESVGAVGFGPEAASAHLRGKHFLGVYPLRPDSTVKFFALDFDKDPDEAWAEAVRQQEMFLEEAGIETYIERSRSGNGYHLWGFFEEPVAAKKVRRALAPFIEDTQTYDRMFPHQDFVDENQPYGNLIALPLYGPGVPEGKGSFVTVGADGQPESVRSQKEFLRGVNRVSVDHLTSLFQDAPDDLVLDNQKYTPREGDPESLIGHWKVTSEKFGCKWIRWAYDHPQEVTEPAWHALACQFAQLDGGRELFHEWSSQDEDRYDPYTTDRKFDHALRQNKPHRSQYINDQGWGPGCDCHERFPGEVAHPFDLARLPLSDLIASVEEEARLEQATEGIDRTLEWLEKVQEDPELGRGKKYGIEELDAVTGIRNGNLIIVGGRPGSGKTAWGIHVAAHLAVNHGVPVYFYSLEMQSRELWLRFLCWLTEIDSQRAIEGKLTAKDWRKLAEARERVHRENIPFFVDDVSMDSNEIVDQVGELVSTHGRGVVFVDYLQLSKKWHNESSRERTERAVSQYRLLGKFTDQPVIPLTQLNRDADDATTESDTADRWLRESGQIEQDAHVIIFILGDKTPGKIAKRILVVHKERAMGGGHRVPVQFNKATSTFASEGTWTFSAQDRHPGDVSVWNKEELLKQLTGGEDDLFGGLGE